MTIFAIVRNAYGMTRTQTHDIPRIPFTAADKLHRAREMAGIPIETMAEALGVSSATAYRYGSGATRPRKLAVEKWADLTGWPAASFYDDPNPPRRPTGRYRKRPGRRQHTGPIRSPIRLIAA